MSKTDGYYWKEGRHYRKVYESPRLYADGVWLVTNQTNAAQRILKLGELTELYPYAQMAQDKDELANYIFQKTTQWFNETLKVYPDGTIQYQTPPAAEIAESVLKFLAMSKKEREEEMSKSTSENKHIDGNGNVVDGLGRIVYRQFSKEKLQFEKEKLEKDLEYINQHLNKWSQ